MIISPFVNIHSLALNIYISAELVLDDANTDEINNQK